MEPGLAGRAFGLNPVENGEPLGVTSREMADLRSYISTGQFTEEVISSYNLDGYQFQRWTLKRALLKLFCTDAVVQMAGALCSAKSLTKALEERVESSWIR